MSMPRLGSVLLLLAYIGGGAWLLHEWRYEVSIESDEIDDRPFVPPKIGTVFAITKSIDTYKAIADRPLFSESRRPAPADSTPDSATASREPVQRAADLSGTRVSAIFKDGESLTALVEFAGGETRAVRQGDDIGAWRIMEIRDDRLILGGRGEPQTLNVYDFDKVVVPRATPAISARARTLDRRQNAVNRRTLPLQPPVRGATDDNELPIAPPVSLRPTTDE